jgi:hypothetical protein
MTKTSLYKTIKILDGEYQGTYKIYYTDHPSKKYEVTLQDGQIITFGAKGYTIAPGTNKGNRYCTRSAGITNRTTITSPNFWSGITWKCNGKRSVSGDEFNTPIGRVRIV